MSRHQIYALLIITTVIWGIQPLAVKFLVACWHPVTVSAMRYWLIGPALIAIACWRGQGALPPKAAWGTLLLMGATGIMLNGSMQFLGLRYSTVVNCTLIAAASPAITAFFAALLLRERLGILAWAGILVSFLGALAIIGRGDIATFWQMSFNEGDLLFLAAQIAWTMYSILAVRAMRLMPAALATGWSGLLGAILTTLFGLFTGTFAPTALDALHLAAFSYTVVLGGVLAMLCWNLGVKGAGPSVTAIFQNITPLVGVLGGALVYHEAVGWLESMGAAAIFLGVYLTTHAHKRTAKPSWEKREAQ